MRFLWWIMERICGRVDSFALFHDLTDAYATVNNYVVWMWFWTSQRNELQGSVHRWLRKNHLIY